MALKWNNLAEFNNLVDGFEITLVDSHKLEARAGDCEVSREELVSDLVRLAEESIGEYLCNNLSDVIIPRINKPIWEGDRKCTTTIDFFKIGSD